MKLKKIFKLKFCYLLNKNTLFILVINFTIIMVFLLFEALFIDQMMTNYEMREYYSNSSIMFIKMLITFFSMYLFAYSVTFKNDFLIYLLLPLGVTRRKSILVTIILNVFIILVFLLIIFIVYSYIGQFISEFYVSQEYYLAFLNIYLIALVYGLYTFLVMQILANFFVMVIMMTMYIITSNIYSEDMLISEKWLLMIFPNISEEGNYFSQGYLVLLIVFLIFINIFLYERRDLNF